MPLLALAGQPNVGKSTLFNLLTGLNQHVGNWPGKTVERREGSFGINGQEYGIVDLPGTYSLTANSPEEIITREFILREQPDLVIAVVNAASLERTTGVSDKASDLLREIPAMSDVAQLDGYSIIDSQNKTNAGLMFAFWETGIVSTESRNVVTTVASPFYPLVLAGICHFFKSAGSSLRYQAAPSVIGFTVVLNSSIQSFESNSFVKSVCATISFSRIVGTDSAATRCSRTIRRCPGSSRTRPQRPSPWA
jgi:energy-coupling factor transporter ATP-binding protein EcfA2